MAEERAAEPRDGKLEAFVGRWRTEGRVRAGPWGPEVPIAGTDGYEWLPGGFFLLHRADVSIGAERVEVFEVIGRDAAGEGWFMHAYDSRGSAGTMRATLSGETWTFQGDGERFTGGFGEDGRVLSGTWELRQGAEWVPWMDVRLTREG
jgi:hypothetical protein